MLDIMSEVATWMEPHFSASKYASLHVNCSKRNITLPTTIKIHSKPIRHPKKSQIFLYVGTPTSHHVRQMLEDIISGIMQDTNTIKKEILDFTVFFLERCLEDC